MPSPKKRTSRKGHKKVRSPVGKRPRSPPKKSKRTSKKQQGRRRLSPSRSPPRRRRSPPRPSPKRSAKGKKGKQQTYKGSYIKVTKPQEADKPLKPYPFHPLLSKPDPDDSNKKVSVRTFPEPSYFLNDVVRDQPDWAERPDPYEEWYDETNKKTGRPKRSYINPETSLLNKDGKITQFYSETDGPQYKLKLVQINSEVEGAMQNVWAPLCPFHDPDFGYKTSGVKGRGGLGKWGPNFAADPIVTMTKEGAIQALLIERKDAGLYAIPGGMVDDGEKASLTAQREFGEEVLCLFTYFEGVSDEDIISLKTLLDQNSQLDFTNEVLTILKDGYNSQQSIAGNHKKMVTETNNIDDLKTFAKNAFDKNEVNLNSYFSHLKKEHLFGKLIAADAQTQERILNNPKFVSTEKNRNKINSLMILLKDIFTTGGRHVCNAFVEDPRNTDNAWMETSVYHYDLDKLKPDVKKKLTAELDEIDKNHSKCDEGQSQWWPLEQVKDSMFASHGKYIDIVYQYLKIGKDIADYFIEKKRGGY